jgi:two-component system cell cycle sensor histidine kinase/response regulator CckA
MRRILVVDDEPDVRRLVARMLRHGGYEVLEAESGAEAAQMFADRGRIDLVVADVMMADVQGPQLAERLRQDSPDLKVLYISGCPDAQDGGRPGRTAFLQKPFTIAEIVGSVGDLLTR